MCVYSTLHANNIIIKRKRELEYFTSSPTKGELAALIM